MSAQASSKSGPASGFLLALLGVAVWAASCSPPPEQAAPALEPVVDAAYVAEIDAWHEEREAGLLATGGWLSVAGLYWLEEGESTFGTAADNDLVFPETTAPAHAGSFVLKEGSITVKADPAAGVTHEGAPVTTLALASDAEGAPTELALGSLTFYPIQRVDQIGIRLKDRERAERRDFSGIERFPVDPAWRIEARFEPYAEPKAVKIPNILGTEFDDVSPGLLHFMVGGESVQLEPTGDPEEGLFVVFGDTTNGHASYGGGRFLAVEPPRSGVATLDFNRAYNPPCVFTPFATCPLPPRQNKLAVAIEAGEKMYGNAEH